MGTLRKMVLFLTSVGAVVTCFLCVLGRSERLRGQTSPMLLSGRIAELRGRIRDEESQHSTPERMGALWLTLANSYDDQFDSGPAEDAFAHALRLLRGSGAKAQYADALDGMGTLYLRAGRLHDAEEFLKKSAEMYVLAPDSRKEAGVHLRYAVALLEDRRFTDAEMQSTRAVRAFEADDKTDATDMISAHLTRSYAMCAQRRCSYALQDVDRAMTLARSRLPANSLDMMAAWMARGVALWKSGDVEDADQAMQESLRIVRTRNDLPERAFISAQLAILQRYEAFLKATHRKKQAKQVGLERAQLQEKQNAECAGCTVNAAAFAPGLLLP